MQEELRTGNPAAHLNREHWDTWDPMLISEGLFAAANIFSNLKLVLVLGSSLYCRLVSYLKSGLRIGSNGFTCALSIRYFRNSSVSPLFWLRCRETSDFVRRKARPNSYIIWKVRPIPDKLRCIRLEFILMNLHSFMMALIELSMASCSAACR